MSPPDSKRPEERIDLEKTLPGARGPRIISAPGEPPRGDRAPDSGELDEPPFALRRTVRRQRPNLLPWLLLFLCLALAALAVLQLYLPLREQVVALRDQEATRQTEVSRLSEEVKTLRQANEQKEATVEQLRKTRAELATRLNKEIAKGDVLISEAQGRLVVDLVDKILFDSGEAELNESGRAVLRQVGETFLKLEDQQIVVTGHTDAVPISPKLRNRYPSNWELSTQRATNVVRFLQDEIGVAGGRLLAAGASEYQPVAKNETKAGRRRNRRIEVMLRPLRDK